jgi:hypothetical protein
MQPDNQPGNPIPPAPQAPQQPPQQAYQQVPQGQPVSFQEQVTQTLQQPAQPQVQPQSQNWQSQTAPQPIQPPQAPQTVEPVQQSSPQPIPVNPQPAAQQQPQPEPVPQSTTLQQTPTAPEAIGSVAVADQIEGGYGYDPGNQEEYDEQGEIDLSEPVTWQAKEFIHQEKGATWFIVFAVTIAAFLAVAIFLMKSWTFALLLVVIAVVIVVLSKRPPRVMEYALSEDGLHIDNTLHKYADFKSFGVVRDSGEFSVMLIPRKRFMPGITVYFPEEAGEDIVDVLGSRLPMRDLHLDVVDKIVRKLRL